VGRKAVCQMVVNAEGEMKKERELEESGKASQRMTYG
jgi:hypothetical protein